MVQFSDNNIVIICLLLLLGLWLLSCWINYRIWSKYSLDYLSKSSNAFWKLETMGHLRTKSPIFYLINQMEKNPGPIELFDSSSSTLVNNSTIKIYFSNMANVCWFVLGIKNKVEDLYFKWSHYFQPSPFHNNNNLLLWTTEFVWSNIRLL